MKHDDGSEEDLGKSSFSTANWVELHCTFVLCAFSYIRIFTFTKPVYRKVVLNSKSTCCVKACLLVALVTWDNESTLLIRWVTSLFFSFSIWNYRLCLQAMFIMFILVTLHTSFVLPWGKKNWSCRGLRISVTWCYTPRIRLSCLKIEHCKSSSWWFSRHDYFGPEYAPYTNNTSL